MDVGRIDSEGVLTGARQRPSPNCDARPAGAAVTLVVVHGISLPPGEFGGDAILDLFANRLDCEAHPSFRGLRGLRVSAHFFIRRDGELWQLVPCAKRAWHAGESRWGGRERCNDFSIGVELEGADAVPYAEEQYSCLAALIVALRNRYPIRDVVGHAHVAPGRKSDPGEAFEWPRLRERIAQILLR